MANRDEIAEGITSLHMIRGLPILGIAQRLDKSQSFLWRICRNLGIETRPLSEANRISAPSRSKHAKSLFRGTDLKKAYLIGFSRGDLNIAEASTISLFVSTTTTHPAFSDLFQTLFSRYGHVYHYPIKDDLDRFKWKVAVRLDRSFDFLLRSLSSGAIAGLSSPGLRAAWLAGLIDTDGNVGIAHSGDCARFRIAVSSSDLSLLSEVKNLARMDGYTFDGPCRTGDKGYVTKKFGIAYQEDHWVIMLQRNGEVKRMLSVLPLMHAEKVAAKNLILGTGLAVKWDSIRLAVEELRNNVARQVAEYAHQAEIAYNLKKRNRGN